MVVFTPLVKIPCPHGCIHNTHSTLHIGTPMLSSVFSIQAVAVRIHIGQQRTEPWPEPWAMITGPCTRQIFSQIWMQRCAAPITGVCARTTIPLLPPYGRRNISLTWQTGCVIWEARTYLVISFRWLCNNSQYNVKKCLS